MAFIVGFTRTAHDPAHNKCCGPLPAKVGTPLV